MTEREEESGPTWHLKELLTLRCISRPSTLATHCQEQIMTVYGYCTYTLSPRPNSARNTSAPASERSGSGLWISLTPYPRTYYELILQSNLTGPGGRMPPYLRAGVGWPCLTAEGTITACKRPPVRACASVGLSRAVFRYQYPPSGLIH